MAKRRKSEKEKPKGPRINNQRRTDAKVGQRTNATIRRLKMYTMRAKCDKGGKPLDRQSGHLLMAKTTDYKVARVQPDRRWFGNTRVVGQKQLDRFRQEMSTK
eukprot:408899_1